MNPAGEHNQCVLSFDRLPEPDIEYVRKHGVVVVAGSDGTGVAETKKGAGVFFSRVTLNPDGTIKDFNGMVNRYVQVRKEDKIVSPEHMNPEPPRNPVGGGADRGTLLPGSVLTAPRHRSMGDLCAGDAIRFRSRILRDEADRLDELAKFADTLPPGSPAEEALWAEMTRRPPGV